MNIGIVTTWFERGASLVSRAYMETLAREHTVRIYARGGEARAVGDPKWDLENVTWGKRCDPTAICTIDWPDLRAWVHRNHLDMLIFNEEHCWDVIVRARRLGLLVGAYVDYYTDETIPFFGLYDVLLCNTRRHYSLFCEHPQALYIPWGTDCDLFRPERRARAHGGIVFFHSAGMAGVNLRKGTDILVRAFQRVVGPAKLVIHSQVGVERYASVADLIQSDARIEFVEGTVGAPGLYHLGDVYVYPSRLEGIGLSIAEAMASGLPVITTDCAPMNEFVRHGETGALVPVEQCAKRSDGYYWPESICSEGALAHAMQSYVDAPELASQQGMAARAYAREHLDWRANSRGLGSDMARLQRISPPKALVRQVERWSRRRLAQACQAQAWEAQRNGQRQLAFRLTAQAALLNPAKTAIPAIGLCVRLLLGDRLADKVKELIGWRGHAQ